MTSVRVLSVVVLTLFLAVFLGTVPRVLGGAAAQITPARGTPLAEVAGHYYQGDGLGANLFLVIEPDGTFRYRWVGCLGTYASAEGQAILKDGELVLKPSSKKGQGLEELSYLPVRWGERRYLAEKKDRMELVNEINLGHEPRHEAYGFLYLREKDWQIPVSGRPDLPPELQGHILEEPAEGAIVREIADSRTFEVDLGARSGLAPGMRLVTEGNKSFCMLEVVSVSQRSLIAKPAYDTCDPLHPGDRVTTSFSSGEAPSPDAPDDDAR